MSVWEQQHKITGKPGYNLSAFNTQIYLFSKVTVYKGYVIGSAKVCITL